MGNTRLLILDEPTKGLGPMGMKYKRNLIEQNVKEEDRIILISSHNLNEDYLIMYIFFFMRNDNKRLKLVNREDIYMYASVQHIPDDIKVNPDVTLLEDNNFQLSN